MAGESGHVCTRTVMCGTKYGRGRCAEGVFFRTDIECKVSGRELDDLTRF